MYYSSTDLNTMLLSTTVPETLQPPSTLHAIVQIMLNELEQWYWMNYNHGQANLPIEQRVQIDMNSWLTRPMRKGTQPCYACVAGLIMLNKLSQTPVRRYIDRSVSCTYDDPADYPPKWLNTFRAINELRRGQVIAAFSTLYGSEALQNGALVRLPFYMSPAEQFRGKIHSGPGSVSLLMSELRKLHAELLADNI